MNTEHGRPITNSTEGADLPLIRTPQDAFRVPHSVVAQTPEDEAAEAEHSRRVSAFLRQRDREQWLRQDRWVAFQKAIHNLQLSPEEVTARVEQFFAPAPVEEEATPIGQ